MCHRAEFSIRSDGIIENFLRRQGTESVRCTIFRSNAVVFFGRIPLVGWSVEGRSDERRSVALPPPEIFQFVDWSNSFQNLPDVPFPSTAGHNAACNSFSKQTLKVHKNQVELWQLIICRFEE